MNVIALDAIERLERVLLEMPQADIRTIHTFLPGKYERKVIIPPWTVLSGAEHVTPYRVRLEQGTIAVNTDEGIKILTAPHEFAVPAGMRRAGRVFEQEVIWVDIYDNPDDCSDIATLEARLYRVPECGLGENRVSAQLEQDHSDYQLLLSQLGVTQSQVEKMMGTHELISMPAGVELELRPSRIHGVGMFALRHFEADEVICPGRIDGHCTPAGRFINHSVRPNAKPVKMGDDIDAVALKQIYPDEEIVINYRDSMLVNIGLEMPCQPG
jgi:hypothetical protein